MRVCKRDFPELEERGKVIVHRRFPFLGGRRDLQSYLEVRLKTLKAILYILDYFERYSVIEKPLQRLERPALCVVIKKEIFGDEIGWDTARWYANFISQLRNYKDLF